MASGPHSPELSVDLQATGIIFFSAYPTCFYSILLSSYTWKDFLIPTSWSQTAHIQILTQSADFELPDVEVSEPLLSHS